MHRLSIPFSLAVSSSRARSGALATTEQAARHRKHLATDGAKCAEDKRVSLLYGTLAPAPARHRCGPEGEGFGDGRSSEGQSTGWGRRLFTLRRPGKYSSYSQLRIFNDPDGSGGADGRRTFPVTERTAQKRRSAALSTEGDDVAGERKIPVPRHKGDSARRNLGQDPVIAGFLLDPTYARKCWCCCHRFVLLSAVNFGRMCCTLHGSTLDTNSAGKGDIAVFSMPYSLCRAKVRRT